jgi:hypothetical protein
VRVTRRLIGRQNRCKAGVGAFEQRAPFLARPGLEQRSQSDLRLGPMLPLQLRRHRRRIDVEAAQQFGVELALDRRHRDPAPIGAFVDLVEMGAGIEKIGAAFVAGEAGRNHPLKRRHQRGRAVDHCGIDDLTSARTLRLENAADDPESQVERAAGEITDQV